MQKIYPKLCKKIEKSHWAKIAEIHWKLDKSTTSRGKNFRKILVTITLKIKEYVKNAKFWSKIILKYWKICKNWPKIKIVQNHRKLRKKCPKLIKNNEKLSVFNSFLLNFYPILNVFSTVFLILSHFLHIFPYFLINFM